MDGQTLTAIAAIAIAAISLMARLFDKSLSIREHEEFRANIKDQFLRISEQLVRDVTRIEQRIETIERRNTEKDEE